MDASYGANKVLRNGVSALGLQYAAAIVPTLKLRKVGKKGELGARMSAKALALSLPKHAWRNITWREGSADPLHSRFARVRVRAAPIRGAAKQVEETLLIEWPQSEAEPTKYWLSTLPAETPFRRLVDIAKMRWRIERDYQDLKQEVGLDHFEGRSWRGFHHHASLSIAAYGFLISERETIPPSGPRSPRGRPASAISGGYRPRGSAAAARTAHSELDRHHAPPVDHSPCQDTAAMPMLCRADRKVRAEEKFVTQ
jgi:SRSO17 transposase